MREIIVSANKGKILTGISLGQGGVRNFRYNLYGKDRCAEATKKFLCEIGD